ncbi:MAG: hypothetical protein ACM3JI_03190 [Anaerolineae bacterium]
MAIQGFAFIPKEMPQNPLPLADDRRFLIGEVCSGSTTYQTYAILHDAAELSSHEAQDLARACKKIQKCLDYLPSFCKGPECWGEAGFRFKGIRIPNTFETANISECGKDVFERCKKLIEPHLIRRNGTPLAFDQIGKNPKALETLEMMLWEEDQRMKPQRGSLLDRIIEKTIKKEQDIEILRILVNSGVKFGAADPSDTGLVDAFNKALEDVLKNNDTEYLDTELLSLAIKAGAFPNAAALKLLQKTQNPSIQKLVARAARAIPIELRSLALKESNMEFIQFLIEERAITKEDLWALVMRCQMEGGTMPFEQSLFNELVESGVLEIETLKTSIFDAKIDLGNFIWHLKEKKGILAQAFIKELLNDPKMLQRILYCHPESYESLILDETLDLSKIQPLLTPEFLEAILKLCPSEELKEKFKTTSTQVYQKAACLPASIKKLEKIFTSEDSEEAFEKESFQTLIKEVLAQNKEELLDSEGLCHRLILKAISLFDIETLELLLENGVSLIDNCTLELKGLSKNQQIDKSSSAIFQVFQDCEEEIQEINCAYTLTFLYVVLSVIDKKLDSSSFKKLAEIRSKIDSTLDRDDCLKELCILMIQAGAFFDVPYHHKSLSSLVEVLNESGLKIIMLFKKADPHQAFESNCLRTLFGEVKGRCPAHELQNLKILIDNGIFSKETLKKFVTEGRTIFQPKDIETLVNLGILDLQAARAFIVNVFGLSRFLRAFDEGRYQEIFSQPFAVKCLQDGAIIQRIIKRLESGHLDPAVFDSLMAKRIRET